MGGRTRDREESGGGTRSGPPPRHRAGKNGDAKLKKTKKPAAPRVPRPHVPEHLRRRSGRLKGDGAAPVERLTYDEFDYETPRPRKRARGSRTAMVNELSDEQRANLGKFDMDSFEEWMMPHGDHPLSEDNRRQVMRQATKLVSGQGVRYESPTSLAPRGSFL